MLTMKGDIIKLAKAGEFDILVHGCNCFCNMGAGLALQIRKEFPEAYMADLETIQGDRTKLGTYSKADILIDQTFKNRYLTIINAYTQFRYGTDRPQVDYEAIRRVFNSLKKEYDNTFRIGIPKIGAGLAGGDWTKIYRIIDYEMQSYNVTVVEYQPG